MSGVRPFHWPSLRRDVLGRIAPIALALVWVLVSSQAAFAEPRRERIIVKFESEGGHALDGCAETLFREGRTFASEARDGSDSLDTLQARVAVREVRALFRRPDGSSLGEQRRRLGQSLQKKMKKKGRRRGRGGPRGQSTPPPPDLAHIYSVEIGEGVAAETALALYGKDPHVAWVQRDNTHQLDQAPLSPNDPFFHSSGSWNQDFDDLWGLKRVRAPEAWSLTQGEGVVVAVVDTGLDYLHPDIAANVWVNPGEDLDANGRVDPADWNGIDDDGNGFIDDLRGFDFANSVDGDLDGFYDGPLDVGDPDPFDDRGHGTHVAGTIAAVANNGIGIAGVAPKARIMPLKGFPAEGEGLDSDLWRAVLYAAHNGARVINTSWSCSPACPRNPLAEEIVRWVHAMGAVIVTSAGNRNADVVTNSPENMREVITVASSGQDDRPSQTFTNFGWGVDVAAPGGGPGTAIGVYVARRNILSLRSSADEGSAPFAVGPDYMRSAGTSMAAPHVSGAVALLLAAYPDLEYADLRRLIRQGAADLGPPGHDHAMGAGRLDIAGAFAQFPLPRLRAALDAPRAGSVLRPGPPETDPEEHDHHDGDDDRDNDKDRDDALQDGPNRIAIRGTASGPDMLDFTLSYGRGNVPDAWLPITPAHAAAVREGVLGYWDIRDADEGTYVVRLEVRAADGRVYREFLPLSLERNRFMPVTAPGPSVSGADLNGRFVAWEARRTLEQPPKSAEHWNAFVTDFLSGRQWTLAATEADERNPSVSRARRTRESERQPRARKARSLVATWSGETTGLGRVQALGCVLNLTTGICPPMGVDPDRTASQSPLSAQGRIFWLAAESGVDSSLRACAPDTAGSECVEYDLGLPPARRSFLRSDGETLTWIEHQGGQRVALCRIDPVTGACPPRVLPEIISPFSRVAVSGNLVAWVKFSFGRNQPLLLCEFDPETGACPPMEVAPNVHDSTPRLAGNRLVWDASVGDEASDVFFCEYDAELGLCPVQRLTAQMGSQGQSAIAGRRVIWLDERAGPVAVYGITLPDFVEVELDAERVTAGRRFEVRVRATTHATKGKRRGGSPEQPPMSLKVEAYRLEDNQPRSVDSAALRLDFEDRGEGRGRLRWQPRARDAGDWVFRFAAQTEAGLVTRKSVRVRVEAEPQRRGRRRGRGGGGHR